MIPMRGLPPSREVSENRTERMVLLACEEGRAGKSAVARKGQGESYAGLRPVGLASGAFEREWLELSDACSRELSGVRGRVGAVEREHRPPPTMATCVSVTFGLLQVQMPRSQTR